MHDKPSPNERIDDRFVLERELSHGSVGSIWSAVELPHRRPVALKLLRPEVASLPHLRRRFAREARAASRLLHPNIASIVDYGVADDDKMYIAMELLDGEVVTELIRRGLSLHHILDLADQLLAGLAHAHARGVIHRDLKPANLMVIDGDLPRRLGTLKIVDFGIARLENERDARETAQGEVVGTPRYMSPEQAAGERQLGARSDLYNVGLILYELITGRAPFGDQKGMAVMASHVHDEVPKLTARADLDVPAPLVAFVVRALQKEQADRWSSAAEMRGIVERLLRDVQSDPQALKVPAPVAESVGDSHSTVEESAVVQPQNIVDDELSNPWGGAAVNARHRTPFVGRSAHRGRLRGLVEALRSEGQGRVVLMEGKAGVGKTRLTMWLKEWAEEKGYLRGHIGSFTRGSAEGMRGLREVLDSLFGTRGMSREEVMQRTEQRLRKWGYDDAVDAGRIADFMRPAGADDVTGAIPLSATKLFATIAQIFEIAARSRPRLIIFDDLHWAGREVGDFLDHLAVEMRHRSVPLMVIGTVRTEELGENPALATRLDALSRYVGETVERIDVGRLARASGRELVRYVLPVDSALCDTIYERSGGNPLHLVLLLRYLRQEGLLEWDGERWIPRDESAVQAAVPPSLADLFRVRVNQVEERHGSMGRLEKLSQRAAIAGPRFTYQVLREMVELEGDADQIANLDDDFDQLLSEGFLIESHGRHEEWYGFSHGVVRDYFLEQIGGAHRARGFHRLAARARETVYEGRADAQASEIAAHWEAARNQKAALQWYLQAARTALRSTTLRQAAQAGRAALRLMDDLLELAEGELVELDVARFCERCTKADVDASTYLAVTVQLGDLHEGFGDYEKAESYYRRVVRLVGSAPPESSWVRGGLAESWLGLGHVAWQRGDFEAAQWAFRRVGELVEGRKSLEEVGVRALRGLARVAWLRGDYETAKELSEVALSSAGQRQDEVGQAKALWLLGDIARIRGDRAIARRRFAASEELYGRADQSAGLARNLLSQAQLERHQKNFGNAEELYRGALGRYEGLGHRRGMGQCYNGLGDVARFCGEYDESRRLYERALEIYESIGARYDVAFVYTNLGLTAMQVSDLEQAREFLDAARKLVAGEEYPYLQAGVDINLALVEAMRGEDQESTQILKRVFQLSEKFPIPDLDYAQPLEELGRLRSQEGRGEEAMQLWQRARDIYGELALTDDRIRLERMMSRESEGG